jgi:DNA-binding MarR family transcriptional regulator
MTKLPQAPGPRYAALIALFRTADTLWNASRAFFDRWDLSPSQFNLLNLIADFPDGLSQADLGRQLLMHRSNVTGLVDRLEARRLVQRRDQAGDRRAYRVVLTAEGRKRVAEIRPHFFAAAEEVWGQCPVARANRWVADLKEIAANAERMANTIKPNSQPDAQT